MPNEIANYNKIKALVADEKSIRHYATVLGNQTQAEKYLNTALQYILKNKKIQLCNPQSVKNCVYDAVNMKLYLDSRQHAYIIPYNNEATLQVGWRGYVAKLKEANQTIDVRVGVIWPEDTFSISESTYIDTYELKRGKPFRSDYNNVSGAFCLLSYTIGNQKYAKITLMGRDEINKVKGCAKTKNVWESWEGEQICKTVIKRAAKVNFASAIADLDAKDNQQYDLNKAKESDNPKVDYVDNGELPKPKEKNIVETTAVEEKKVEGQVDDDDNWD